MFWTICVVQLLHKNVQQSPERQFISSLYIIVSLSSGAKRSQGIPWKVHGVQDNVFATYNSYMDGRFENLITKMQPPHQLIELFGVVVCSLTLHVHY